ncbi:TetR/AcrR family transcriptional regulator [Millisia brevis]|uniref:TetR/AcrR family transcriptional regulator n=1 Tax=Millisia brevis TaxID=264148 RepID=UPI000831D4CE|nr:TetR/AcrR family transcriptional regulator [Millisia brevis]
MPRIVDHAQRRREIIHGVWEVILTGGIQAVSLRRVAAAAGVSVGRIQHYFADRDDLLRHGCDLLIEGGAERFEESIVDADPAETLRTLVLRTIPTTPTFTAGTILWTAYRAYGITDPVIREQIQRTHLGVVDRAAELIDRARASGTIPAGDNSGRVAMRLLATADGYALRVLSGDLPAAEARAALESDLADLGCPPAPSAPVETAEALTPDRPAPTDP